MFLLCLCVHDMCLCVFTTFKIIYSPIDGHLVLFPMLVTTATVNKGSFQVFLEHADFVPFDYIPNNGISEL